MLKGTDRLCKVVKLCMQCCGQIQDSFKTYKTCPRCIIILSLSAIVEVQIMTLGGYVFRIGFFELLNNDDEKKVKIIQ